MVKLNFQIALSSLQSEKESKIEQVFSKIPLDKIAVNKDT